MVPDAAVPTVDAECDDAAVLANRFQASISNLGL